MSLSKSVSPTRTMGRITASLTSTRARYSRNLSQRLGNVLVKTLSRQFEGGLRSALKNDYGIIDLDGRTSHTSWDISASGVRCPCCPARSPANLAIKSRRSPRRRGSALISAKNCTHYANRDILVMRTSQRITLTHQYWPSVN